MAVAFVSVRRRATDTDRPAFEDVAAAHLVGVHRYLTQMVRDPVLAEDLTADTFERAYRNWHRFDPERGSPMTWLVTIARRLAVDHARSESRRKRREDHASRGEPTSTAPPEPSPFSSDIAQALDSLTDTEREVVALRVVLDIDGPTTARLMGITPSACSTTLHRAMSKLRREVTS